jgi:phosphoserine/homoserine phosphotransferase
MAMEVVCFDLEGVFVPEIWINVAETTGIEDLRLTTRDMADYDALMAHRLAVLRRHDLGIADVQAVIARMRPLPGALEFLDWVRPRFQVIVLSDTYYEFATPLMAHLGFPALLCHNLDIDGSGRIAGWKIRLPRQKLEAVRAFQRLNFTVFATGDSYNDTDMLLAADRGFLFCPPPQVVRDFPALPVVTSYDQLRTALIEVSSRNVR